MRLNGLLNTNQHLMSSEKVSIGDHIILKDNQDRYELIICVDDECCVCLVGADTFSKGKRVHIPLEKVIQHPEFDKTWIEI